MVPQKQQHWSISHLKSIPGDFSISAVVVGLIATIVSYAGPLLIVFQAAQSAGLSEAELSSWIWAISIGSGLTAIILSIWFKTPVITAWSTPDLLSLQRRDWRVSVFRSRHHAARRFRPVFHPDEIRAAVDHNRNARRDFVGFWR